MYLTTESDDDAERQAGDECVVTPEMMEVGYRVLEDSGRLLEGPLSSDRLLASEVFEAMWARRPGGSSPPQS